ncbi:hypothetical protein THASP1DRAFT_31681 [Thamnocephalis sphaerospora]|uniref:Uncharacterized protein n=1 Tax=Thamnocephalis sphaerospora TaxID=78915 RepID=A0A4P9XMK4_9FUNG|nr:hypothetical protein THASP1DRAFT_31681 [Thamnocephalis sphaerospora]|eukprot:RKP06500.1 hypothetical protein THASP1DRAFT_31681 [Thamnocephalis sphaerospora]
MNGYIAAEYTRSNAHTSQICIWRGAQIHAILQQGKSMCISSVLDSWMLVLFDDGVKRPHSWHHCRVYNVACRRWCQGVISMYQYQRPTLLSATGNTVRVHYSTTDRNKQYVVWRVWEFSIYAEERCIQYETVVAPKPEVQSRSSSAGSVARAPNIVRYCSSRCFDETFVVVSISFDASTHYNVIAIHNVNEDSAGDVNDDCKRHSISWQRRRQSTPYWGTSRQDDRKSPSSLRWQLALVGSVRVMTTLSTANVLAVHRNQDVLLLSLLDGSITHSYAISAAHIVIPVLGSTCAIIQLRGSFVAFFNAQTGILRPLLSVEDGHHITLADCQTMSFTHLVAEKDGRPVVMDFFHHDGILPALGESISVGSLVAPKSKGSSKKSRLLLKWMRFGRA